MSTHPSIQTVMPMRVLNKRPLAEGIFEFELADASGDPLPDWTPGAHIDVQIREHGGREVFRAYSLCGPALAPTWRIAVRQEADGRGGSTWLHQSVGLGDVLQVRGPRNLFPLKEGAGPSLLFAGGIGITPLISMARQLQAQGREFSLQYHVRHFHSAAFLDELQAPPLAEHVHVWSDDAAPAPLDTLLAGVRPDTRVYVCGPSGYMEAVTRCAQQAGVAADHIHRENFAPPVDAVAAPERKEVFTVRLASSGQEIEVAPNQTVVRALEAAGVPVVVSCEQGFCGSCLVRVIDGIPDHRDQFLLPEEQARNDSFTPCCSRSLTPCLVLDL